MSSPHATDVTRHAVLASLCIAALATSSAVASPRDTACSIAEAPREDFVMRMPFETVDGRIYVQARVNGRGPFRFAIDTGASGLGRADASLVSALGLEIGQPTANSDGVETAQADTTRLESLDLGGLVRENLQVITRDYNSRMAPEAAFAGIIARDFFADGLLVIDYPEKMISFSRTRSLSRGQPGVMPYERPFRIPVSIAGRRTWGNLDTGANVAFVLPRSLFDETGGTPLETAGHGRLANSRVDTMRSTVHGPFEIGIASVRDAEVRVSDSYPELLIGAYALQDFTVLVDQRSRSVAVCP